jgi:transcriptional regulator with XRE-family HTH domain
MTRPAPTLDLDAGESRRACETWPGVDRRAFGRRLVEARLRRGWRERVEAAEQAGVDVKSLRDWERGRYLPSVQSLYLLAWCYRVTVDWLLRGER